MPSSVSGTPPANMVTTDTVQTVTAVKTLSADTTFAGGAKIQKWNTVPTGGEGTWIDLPDGAHPSGIGNGGVGINVLLGIPKAAGHFFSDAVSDDLIFRARNAKVLRLGVDNGAGSSASTVRVHPDRLEVVGASGILDNGNRVYSASNPPPGGSTPPWAGVLHAGVGSGEPEWEQQWLSQWGNQTVAITPTNVTLTVGRLTLYRCDYAITVNRIRWYGLAAAQTAFRMSVYNATTGAQVVAPQIVSTTATEGWQSVQLGTAVTLTANTPYWVGLSATATGTQAALRTSIAPGLYPPLPSAQPANLNAVTQNRHRFAFAQVALTNGVWPATLPALVRATGWTGTLPMFIFDNATAA